jgi:hypothetical protein
MSLKSINLFNCFKISSQPGAVAHICNPNYSGGRDQEDHGSRTVRAKSLQDPISTNG